MTERLRISTSDNKYTVICREDEQGRHVTYLLHGEPWPQGMYHQNDVMLALARDLEAARAEPRISLTDAEVHSGMDRQRNAELLISQLPSDHDGRNTWLMNYGTSVEAVKMRGRRGLVFSEEKRAVVPA